jgi:hypothetical protein
MKVQTVGSVSEFLRRQEEPFSAKVERHFKKYGFVYKVAGISVILLAVGGTVSATSGAAVPVFASGGIEVGAEKLYSKLLVIGKWVIIFKGGFDIIKNLTNGDMDSAKKGFMSYLLIYLLLFGLPWVMDEIEVLFQDLKVNA